jgi:hypothetical protein
MAGRGPAPKAAHRRARTNADPIPTSTIRFELADQPDLPQLFDKDGIETEWHSRTVAWWAMWRDAPQAEHFMASDWDFLLDTALMHHAMWSKGQWTLAAEVRLRVAKFGATPEDRARLRMQFAEADGKDPAGASGASSARERRGALHALPTPAPETPDAVEAG